MSGQKKQKYDEAGNKIYTGKAIIPAKNRPISEDCIRIEPSCSADATGYRVRTRSKKDEKYLKVRKSNRTPKKSKRSKSTVGGRLISMGSQTEVTGAVIQKPVVIELDDIEPMNFVATDFGVIDISVTAQAELIQIDVLQNAEPIPIEDDVEEGEIVDSGRAAEEQKTEEETKPSGKKQQPEGDGAPEAKKSKGGPPKLVCTCGFANTAATDTASKSEGSDSI